MRTYKIGDIVWVTQHDISLDTETKTLCVVVPHDHIHNERQMGYYQLQEKEGGKRRMAWAFQMKTHTQG